MLLFSNDKHAASDAVFHPGLSKPAFSPTGGKFVVGTEEQNPFSKMQNRLIFGQLDGASNWKQVILI